MISNKNKILWVEDDEYSISDYITEFEANEFEVIKVSDAKLAKEELEKNGKEYCLAVIDVRMDNNGAFDTKESHGGYRTGILLASYIISKYSHIKIIGFSAYDDSEIRRWFKNHDLLYILKNTDANPKNFCERAMGVLKIKRYFPRIFIVHGHDKKLKEDLRKYIEHDLDLGKPVILSDEPNNTRTIIEKFEEEGNKIDIVFVLMTPDDKIITKKDDVIKYRARKNVIFELGYFFGKMKRKNGNIIVLYKENVEIPTDILGIAYINITNGIENADEEIKRELSDFLTMDGANE